MEYMESKMQDHYESSNSWLEEFEQLKAERDALTAQVEFMRSALELALISVKTCYKQDWAPISDLSTVEKAIKLSPQQCLAEIKAEAVIEFAKEYGGKFSGLPDFASSVVSLFADQYAAKIRNTGTWLKDSNVNGGKRQSGAR